MSGQNEARARPGLPLHDPERALESMLIEQYLRNHGHTQESLSCLAGEEARRLLADASAYASGRMAEVETRARLMQEIHRRTKTVE